MTNFFKSLGFTRDDAKWTIGIVAAIIVGLASLGNGIVDYGIPLGMLPYLRLGALIVGIVSARMASSGLPSQDAATTVSPSKLPPAAMILLAAALSVPVLGLSACAKKAPSTSPTVTVDPIVKAAGLAGAAVLSAQAAEQQLYASGAVKKITAADQAKINDGFAKLSDAVLKALDAYKGAKTALTKQQLVDAVKNGVQQVMAQLRALSASELVAVTGWLNTAASLIDIALATS